mmetsp:Transcript_109128/g.307659  ORF Transcript_109128/g.307659 Transcript_109128/m.307659 type:complete len:230 (+) Transcript_109128:347-1036(+)
MLARGVEATDSHSEAESVPDASEDAASMVMRRRTAAFSTRSATDDKLFRRGALSAGIESAVPIADGGRCGGGPRQGGVAKPLLPPAPQLPLPAEVVRDAAAGRDVVASSWGGLAASVVAPECVRRMAPGGGGSDLQVDECMEGPAASSTVGGGPIVVIACEAVATGASLVPWPDGSLAATVATTIACAVDGTAVTVLAATRRGVTARAGGPTVRSGGDETRKGCGDDAR